MNTVLRSAARRAATRTGRSRKRLTPGPTTGYAAKRHMADQTMDRPVEDSIRTKLTEYFKPVHLDVVNESYMHSVPRGSESHFKVIVVSDKFDKKPLIQRHRMVNEALSEELKHAVHALSILAKTPAQWQNSQRVPQSPACRGGAGL